MKTLALWFLVTSNYGTYYSPPMATKAECEILKSELKSHAPCVKINVVQQLTGETK